MKRRSFLKGLVSLSFGLSIFKNINTDPIKLKPKPEMFNIDINGGDGGYLVPKEIRDILIKRIHETNSFDLLNRG